MKIVIGGQLRKDEIKEKILEIKPDAEIEIKSDLEAAMAMQGGEFDLYLGSCDTGGGGALAMAVSLLGVDKAKTVATQSMKKPLEEIVEMVKSGVIAFGFVESEVNYSVENILEAWKGKNE